MRQDIPPTFPICQDRNWFGYFLARLLHHKRRFFSPHTRPAGKTSP